MTYRPVRQATRQMWTHDLGTVAVDYDSQGDEFIHHIEQRIGMMPMRDSDGASPAQLGPPLRGPESRLDLYPMAGAVRCEVVGEDVEQTPDQIEPWAQAVSAAAEATGRTSIAFTWQAVIGTAAIEAGLDRLGPLEHEAEIGPITLEPGGVCMRESIGDHDRIDQSLAIRHSFPLIATGRVTTYNWNRAQGQAELQLGRVCALLSLATAELWVPRSFPRERHAGGPPLTIPATSPHYPHIAILGPVETRPWTGEITRTEPGFTLPDWFPGTWDALARDDGLAQAVHAHYEAMSLATKHPSTAFLMFVATIEGVGKALVPEAMCESHPECPHPKPFSQKRFYKALRTAVPRSEADRLNKFAYKVRSSTGHEGSLFGTERSSGYAPLSMAAVDLQSVFDIVVVRGIQNASARVVGNMLKTASLPTAEVAD